ncbi:MAG: hypothetical protein GF308_05045 [Candidatus Heimdallarchaeota archaeon]|nr:hypothetical protein [Candidatus Heimdallarchaeota archaeon]
MKARRQISLIIGLILVLMSFITITNDFVQANKSNSFSSQKFKPGAINVTTFKGIMPVTCFCGPDNAYDVIYDSLSKAQTSFYLEVYTLSSQPLVNALISAKNRGVEVIVLLSHDRVSGYEDAYTEEAAFRLYNAGIDVLWTNGTTFVYTHAKFWVVDHQLTFVYSGNWAPSSIPQSPEARKNREMGIIFNDTDVATYYENVFFDDFFISEPYNPVTGGTGDLQANETGGTYEHPFDPITITEYVEVTPVFSNDNSYELLSQLIQSANTSIDVELQYIKDDCDLLDDLIDAADRGVSVRVLIPEPDQANENVTQTLFSHGIAVRYFKGLGHNHNKFICVDGKLVSISSINWSQNSLYNNREAGAIVKNTNIADYFTSIFDFDWAKGEIPAGGGQPVTLISPQPSGIASGTYNFQASFTDNNYTSGELFIDATSVHTWNNPLGVVSVNIDTTTYSNGIHDISLIGQPENDSAIQVDAKFNIINTADWLLLITEIRFDANTEPDGEFFEIYNGFNFKVLIGSWKFTDNEDSYTILADTEIAAEEALIFARNDVTFATEMDDLGIPGATADIVYGDILLANSGDELIFQDPAEEIVDAVAWGSGSVSGVVSYSGSVSESQTLQRVPATQDTDDCSVDFIADTPTPGTITSTPPPTTSAPPTTTTEETSTELIPTGFISGFVISLALLTFLSISLITRFLWKKRK